MTKKQFEFPLRTVKAFERNGVKHIIAVASDNKLDLYWEFFSPVALGEMVKNCNTVKENKPQEGFVDLQETHRESFGFGYADRGWLNETPAEKAEETKLYELYIDFALKDGHACGIELYNEIRDSQVVKQLSVGGYIENFEDDTEWEELVLNDDDGNEITIQALKINHFVLEHVAVTPGGWAVNPRTRFESVKGKDLGFMGSIFKSVADEEIQKRLVEERDVRMKGRKPVTSTPPESKEENVTNYKAWRESIKVELPIMINKMMVDILGERDGQMTNMGKAQKHVEELKGLELTEDERKEVNLSFVPESSEEVEVPDVTEEIAKALGPVMETIQSIKEEIAKGKDEVVVEETETEKAIKALTADFDKKFESLNKSLTEKDSTIKDLTAKVDAFGSETQTATDTPAETDVDVNKGTDVPIEEDTRTLETMWEN